MPWIQKRKTVLLPSRSSVLLGIQMYRQTIIIRCVVGTTEEEYAGCSAASGREWSRKPAGGKAISRKASQRRYLNQALMGRRNWLLSLWAPASHLWNGGNMSNYLICLLMYIKCLVLCLASSKHLIDGGCYYYYHFIHEKAILFYVDFTQDSRIKWIL